MQRRSFSLLPWLAVGLVWIVSGCRPEQPVRPEGSARFVGHFEQALTASGVARVEIELTAPDLDSSRLLSLEKVDGTWGGTMAGIPAGAERTFTAEAFGVDGTKMYAGKATGVTISAGETVLVAITLQRLSPSTPFENAVPVIDSLVASASAVAPGGSLTLTATAHDANPGDVLTYAWTAPAGTFGSASSAATSWTAPSAEGPVPLTLVVTDSHGASDTLSISVTVRTGTGGADIDISLNNRPRVEGITASPSRVLPGASTTLAVTASDVDGDALTYHWSASGCSGRWVDERSATARFTPDAVPAAGSCECHLGVTVEDGRGGQETGTLSLCVSEPPRPSLPPEVVSTGISVSPGRLFTLRVEAKDPQGSTLGFAWSASRGTLGTPVKGASASEVPWTAPACGSAGETLSVTVTVSNALGLSTPYTFRFGGLPECAPPPGTWAAIGGLNSGADALTTTLLPSGRVLVIDRAGFWGATAEVYDPATGLSVSTGLLKGAHTLHTATLLPSGKVLVAGGETAAAELYDPATDTWSSTGSLAVSRADHTATLLPSGKVLVVGGYTRGGSTGATALDSAELYDPAAGTWSPVASMSVSHQGHTATLLPSGKVLVAGGDSAVAELYDPEAGTWTLTGPLGSRRTWHAAALLRSGQVLVVGGSLVGGEAARTAELYDPAAGTWSPTGAMARPRSHASVAVLPSGKVLVAGGSSDQAELYDPVAGTWAATTGLAKHRERNALVALPSGKVVLLGGSKEAFFAEVFDPAAETWAAPGRAANRAGHTLMVLPSGKVLAAGGFRTWESPGLDSAELYDPVTRSWSATGSLLQARLAHTSTLLPSGKVLVAGGMFERGTELETAELYDPAAGTWSPAGSMALRRVDHTATLLPSGKVLVVGGCDSAMCHRSAELYDPAANTWSPAAVPLAARRTHTATLLPSGKVLVVGGAADPRTVELYDPVTDTWSWAAPSAIEHQDHTATLLPSGKVLVVGGSHTSEVAELYDPETGTWSLTGVLRFARYGHTATLLPSGQVLVVGGTPWVGAAVVEVRADLYDPDTGVWTAMRDTGSLRIRHRAVLLPSGQVLVVGTAYAGYGPGMLYTP
ncbi:hypothetical protein NR798_46965 [Archangium gephyra]|uniref:Kelch repeat-containing protein n=1 Tax=Archangium gephyra TaxID=48 RepID=UPI0035D4A0D7